MARKPAPTKAHEPEASPADQAFGAARAFVEHLATLAYHARHFQPRPDKPDAWQDPAMTYAKAFVAWFDLSHLLTPAVRTEARRVYPPGSPAIKLGKAKPTPTVIEAVADELGVYFRNTVYADRRHPLEPNLDRLMGDAKARATVRARLGIKTLGDGWMLMVDEWKKQPRERGESALSLLRCESIDFDDLQTLLIREAEAVIAAASKPNAPVIDPAILARLEAAVAGLPAVLEGNRTGFERGAGVIESLDPRDDGPKPKPTRRERKAKWLAEAMLTVRDRPEWSDATIAKQVGIDKSRLSRSREYQVAARMARTPKTPDGSVMIADGDRSVEAVDDSFDPNRPASRQWQDEEDTDDRIDCEMNERNAKRNGRR